jgi:phage terminase small subunit
MIVANIPKLTYKIKCMGQVKRLTEMQIKFAHELVTNEGRMNGTEAAVAAGYSPDTARNAAYKLQNPKISPLVVQYIGELRAENQKKYDITFESHITELGKIKNEALKNKAWSAAVNAEVARGKVAGLYVEQKIIRTGKLDDLSEEELDKRIAEVLDEYSPILEGVEVDELKSDVVQKQKDIRLGKPQRPPKKEKILVNYSSSSSSSSDQSSGSSESESQS